MTETLLGKIDEVHLGVHDGRFGLHILLTSGTVCIAANTLCWDPETVPPTKNARWTLKDQDAELVVISRKISKLLAEAQGSTLDDLKGVPIEMRIEDNMLAGWRILTEVL